MATAVSWEEGKEHLRKWREENARQSAETLELGEFVLANHKKLGDEVWSIYEQVSIAALDVGDIEEATDCIEALKMKFPDSTRVKRLQGMKLEAQGRYDDAKLVYEELLKDDASNAMIRKRFIAIMKAQDRIPDAIKELNKYLESFMADHEAWLELSELYIQEQNYSKAAFCFEELIMSNPHNHLYHQRYAEIRYTQGGTESMEIAKKYFAQAVKLNSNNIRALYGLFLRIGERLNTPQDSREYLYRFPVDVATSHKHMVEDAVSWSRSGFNSPGFSTESQRQRQKDNMKCANWASKQLAHRYRLAERKEAEHQVHHLEKMIDSLQILSS